MKERGFTPGIVSRGYRGRRSVDTTPVYFDSDPALVGDEAPLLAMRTDCPVVVSTDRVDAVRELLAENACDVVISDDGLQHYALSRDFEIVVVDGERGFGNGRCLPAGPLREPVSRLREVDVVVANGRAECVPDAWIMELAPTAFVNMRSGERIAASDFAADGTNRVHAFAGIGNPQRFFASLERLGLTGEFVAFPDHHEFVAADLAFDDELPIVVTEKDATKIRRFGDRDVPPHCWYLEIDVVMPQAACDAIGRALNARAIVPQRKWVAQA